MKHAKISPPMWDRRNQRWDRDGDIAITEVNFERLTAAVDEMIEVVNDLQDEIEELKRLLAKKDAPNGN